ncbi:flagellar biosynthesis regulator FlaF [Magnetospirillum moscoviense]|uniref:Flagellar protein FlaF n=1 Tax=Magnetospirillum moscoviense TaxID=1437059 RepID=A0A178MQJ8_9PROT|nr:flagellar biosynthesis regulator FlaF [Magnetospirillum moscoviense]OAN50793.1 hypothetical protein A6A05_11780 [Magnetospirillum moscoviense]
MRQPASPYGAYERMQATGLKGRAGEAMAFVRAANALEAACRAPVSRAILDNALKRNQKLWTLVQIEVTAPDHPLPAPIRANLLDLSRFVDHQTIKALSSGRPDDARCLIEIDREIAAGLMA